MDDTKPGFFTSVFVSLSLVVTSHAADFEYVTPELRASLEQDFNSPNVIPIQDHDLKNKIWTCEMYGMRSHLQVYRGVKLYNWNRKASWQNAGSQIVSEYQIKDGTLIGQSGRFEDKIKLNHKGQLLSQLSMLRPQRGVVAYAVCTAI